MVDQKKKGKYIGLAGALLMHVAFIAFLLLVAFKMPEQPEEGGMPVMMGEIPDALGGGKATMTEVDVLPQEAAPTSPEPSEQEMITQTEEETVAVPEKKKEETKKPAKPEKTEAEKAAEARRLAAEKAERERKAAEERARKQVAGAFGRGAQMSGSGSTQGKGVQGSPTGNDTSGATTGNGGYGTFNLGGRSLSGSGLPRPVYNVQDEGMVVVNITVNPAGYVIATSINLKTNTVNASLRRAAEEAAKKARFNAIDGLNNQSGTITYYFKLK